MQLELGRLETGYSPLHPQIYRSAGVLPAHHDSLEMDSCGGKKEQAMHIAEQHTQISLVRLINHLTCIYRISST